MNVLVCGAVSALGERVLRDELAPPPYHLEFTDDTDPLRAERLARCEAVLVDQAPLTEADFARMTRLRLVQRLGRGQFDISGELAAARARGVPVAHNRSGFAARATAEHTVMVILALLRQLPDADAFVRSGQWREAGGSHRFDAATRQLDGASVALVGMGRVGRATARLLAAFGAEVAYWSRTRLAPGEERDLAAVHRPLDELLAAADVVSLHIRPDPAAPFVFDTRLFGLMRPGGYFVNTSRGTLVDEHALAGALRAGHLAGAALDVFTTEPPGPSSPLDGSPHLLLTPHIAGRTREVAEMYFRSACANIHRLRAGHPLRDLVDPVAPVRPGAPAGRARTAQGGF
ncbi:NAD(P)-dependent oxidoreductase [Streptomyces caatingaensis]|uniref:NAD(P)-dependent oxidoreductase n=1 Tax=Streptomyces caatingaensis TaxID=1678637 RepID=UPI0006728749|nr:NAD(P)-dependent oxidoreductase [Streptomyces caatingaensis]